MLRPVFSGSGVLDAEHPRGRAPFLRLSPVAKTPAPYLDQRRWMGPSYAEAARAILGAEAEAYLARLSQVELNLPQTAGGTDVYVFARR
ncbi:MAG: hypothetical protein HY316_09910 [Acidobacteria bacterium]|nr:hypothetical protein [Acidobacteriota bacterium]